MHTGKKNNIRHRCYRKTHPKEICRNKRGITRWAPGPNCAHSECFWLNCYWLWDTINSCNTRFIRNFFQCVLRGIFLFSPLSHLFLVKAWASALVEEHAVPVACLPLLSISKSSWDAPRARISFCILHWDNHISNIEKEVTWQSTFIQRQSGEWSMCLCCSCGLPSARKAAGRDNALAVSKAYGFFGNASCF